MFIKEPIRKRGYYRALRAGKSWAILRKGMNDMINLINKDFFNDMINPNPLMKMIGIGEMMNSYEVKVEYVSKLPKLNK